MEELYVQKTKELRIQKKELERKLNVAIQITGKKVSIEGDPVKEYEASIILEAISFGFSVTKALLLLEEDMIFRKLNVKDYTRRKNTHEVRGRVIGTHGKTKKTIEEISGCEVVINDTNEIGIIGSAESISLATTALKNLIRGSKQANVYRFLERTNRSKKVDDLGLKDKKEE